MLNLDLLNLFPGSENVETTTASTITATTISTTTVEEQKSTNEIYKTQATPSTASRENGSFPNTMQTTLPRPTEKKSILNTTKVASFETTGKEGLSNTKQVTPITVKKKENVSNTVQGSPSTAAEIEIISTETIMASKHFSATTTKASITQKERAKSKNLTGVLITPTVQSKSASFVLTSTLSLSKLATSTMVLGEVQKATLKHEATAKVMPTVAKERQTTSVNKGISQKIPVNTTVQVLTTTLKLEISTGRNSTKEKVVSTTPTSTKVMKKIQSTKSWSNTANKKEKEVGTTSASNTVTQKSLNKNGSETVEKSVNEIENSIDLNIEQKTSQADKKEKRVNFSNKMEEKDEAKATKIEELQDRVNNLENRVGHIKKLIEENGLDRHL